MAHFALLDENNVTVRCIVVDNSDCLDENGNESEAVGATFCTHYFGGRWVQTSINKTFRKNYAGGEGWIWDVEKDMFYRPQPFPSWVLNEENGKWIPPKPIWDDGKLKIWIEDEGNWIYVDDIENIEDIQDAVLNSQFNKEVIEQLKIPDPNLTNEGVFDPRPWE